MSRAAVSLCAGGNSVPPACDNDDAHAYELMRRAICHRDDDAWSAVVARYTRMVQGWVRQYPGGPRPDEDDARVNRAFERFWRAIGPDRFDRFVNLAALLAYLKMCAMTVVLDEVRATRHQRQVSLDRLLAEDAEFGGAAAPDDLEADVASRFSGRAVWRLIESALPQPTDRLLVYLSFVAGLPPAAIAQRYPTQFPTAADVYRRKALVLERLRRAPALKELAR
jgi:DNA-directed RNA polymerase specialized sigma24 family protein